MRGKRCFVENGKCSACGGSGWILYRKLMKEYDPDVPVEVAGPCPKCRADYVQDISGIPKEYASSDSGTFDFSAYGKDMEKEKAVANDFVMNFGNWIIDGQGLYLWSTISGSGKTYLACSLARSVLLKYKTPVRFITAASYLDKIRESYGENGRKTGTSDLYKTCEFLVLDDLGAIEEKGWTRQVLSSLIHARYAAGKVTVITSSVPPDELNLEGSALDRLNSTCIVVHMPEQSIRQEYHFKRNQQKIEKIMERRKQHDQTESIV